MKLDRRGQELGWCRDMLESLDITSKFVELLQTPSNTSIGIDWQNPCLLIDVHARGLPQHGHKVVHVWFIRCVEV